MERVNSSSKASFLVWAIIVLDLVLKASGNAEGGLLPFNCSINVSSHSTGALNDQGLEKSTFLIC